MLKNLNQQYLRASKVLIILCVGVCIGWLSKGVYVEIQELTCADYSTKHAMWVGFSSTKNEQVRCFWVESAYPWRVRQGVVE